MLDGLFSFMGFVSALIVFFIAVALKATGFLLIGWWWILGILVVAVVLAWMAAEGVG
jgi:hypothetical protein